MKTKTKGNLLIGFLILFAIVVIITVIGLFALSKPDLVLQGVAEATEVRVSGKVAGRIESIRVHEGQRVTKGDTLVLIDSPEIAAKLQQAVAAQSAAQSQNDKAIKGARKELITGAYEQWKKALVGVDLAKKSFARVENLFTKGVMTAQKRDEALANLQAAEATAKAARSQYDMARNGAEREDIDASGAVVDRARGAVAEVEAYLPEMMLRAPITGEIFDIFPKVGELIGTGAPIMNIVDLDDIWITFNVREEMLTNITIGREFTATMPALGSREVTLKVYYIKAVASYANWKATKVVGQYDAKTFEVRAKPTSRVEGLRPGMTALAEWSKIQ